MQPQIGTLTLWDNPVLGFRDGVYNTPAANVINLLGEGTIFTNVAVRSMVVTENLKVDYQNNLEPQRFTYARFVGGGQTTLYFVTSSTVTQNVLHLTLQLDPQASFPYQLAGITERMHSSQASPVHEDYFNCYDPEDTYMVIRNVANTLGTSLNPTRRFILTNVDLNNRQLITTGATPEGNPIPLVTTNLTFPIITNPANQYTAFVKPNTAAWEQSAATQQRLEALQSLNMTQSVQFAYQLPQNVQLTGSFPISQLQFNVINTTINIESGYTGTNVPLRRKTLVSVKNVGTGQEVQFFGWEFGGTTGILASSALCTPEGNAFHYFTSATLNGIGDRGSLPLSDRLINSPNWQQGVLDFVSPAGETFAAIQSRMQRDTQNQAYRVQTQHQEWQRQQDNINQTRANIASISAAAGLLVQAGTGNQNLLQLAGLTGAAISTGGAIGANTAQGNLNDKRNGTAFGSMGTVAEPTQNRLNREGRDLILAQINEQERVRRTVSPTRKSSPATNLSNSSIGHEIIISVASLHSQDVAKLDRMYNAFGYNINRYLTSLPTPRATHNFYLFQHISVSIPNHQLAAIFLEAMFLTGVRIWRVNPTIQGIYNNF